MIIGKAITDTDSYILCELLLILIFVNYSWRIANINTLPSPDNPEEAAVVALRVMAERLEIS